MLMENIHVDVAKYGDRLDHISAIGRVKRRIEIMNRIPGKPLVLVLNLQIPGDPPVSVVFYYLFPLSFFPGTGAEIDPSNAVEVALEKTRKLFKKFVDLPFTPVKTESEEFLLQQQMERVNRANKAVDEMEVEQCRERNNNNSTDSAAAAAGNGKSSSSSSSSTKQKPTTGTSSKSSKKEKDSSCIRSVHYVEPAPRSWVR
jgi:hypothetical protein